MKLTQSDIEAIERFLTMHQSGKTGVEISKEYGVKNRQLSTSLASNLRRIGVDIPSARRFAGFNNITSAELAEFRVWKAAKEAAEK